MYDMYVYIYVQPLKQDGFTIVLRSFIAQAMF